MTVASTRPNKRLSESAHIPPTLTCTNSLRFTTQILRTMRRTTTDRKLPQLYPARITKVSYGRTGFAEPSSTLTHNLPRSTRLQKHVSQAPKLSGSRENRLFVFRPKRLRQIFGMGVTLSSEIQKGVLGNVHFPHGGVLPHDGGVFPIPVTPVQPLLTTNSIHLI